MKGFWPDLLGDYYMSRGLGSPKINRGLARIRAYLNSGLGKSASEINKRVGPYSDIYGI